MEYLLREGCLLIRQQLNKRWSSFSFIPTTQYITIRKGFTGSYAVYLFPTTREMYKNTRQISYPRRE